MNLAFSNWISGPTKVGRYKHRQDDLLISVHPDWNPPLNVDGSGLNWPERRLRAFSWCIGVLLFGDGCVYETKEHRWRNGKHFVYIAYRVCLNNKSPGFMKYLNEELATILGRRPLLIQGPNKDGHYMMQSRCESFVLWWQGQTLASLRRIIDCFPIEYLRGRFDSDGNVNLSQVSLCGAEPHRHVMEFDWGLCNRPGMRTGKFSTDDRIRVAYYRGRRIASTQPGLRFGANSGDFLKIVGGFTVEWRDKALKSYYRGRKWTPRPASIRFRAVELADRGRSPRAIQATLSREFDDVVPRAPSTVG
jgi:hypothetical protein